MQVIPQFPLPNDKKAFLIFMDHQKKGATKFHGSETCGNNTCCCLDKGDTLAGHGVSFLESRSSS